jgi:hypothetical protein
MRVLSVSVMDSLLRSLDGIGSLNNDDHEGGMAEELSSFELEVVLGFIMFTL